MSLKPLLRIDIADLRAVFGDVTAPTVSFSETMREANRLNTATRDGTFYDEALSCLYLQPLYVPVSEVTADWTFSANQTFKRVQHSVAETYCIIHAAWGAGHEADEWSATTGAGTTAHPANGTDAHPEGAGQWIWLYRDAPRPGATRGPDDCYVRVRFTGSGATSYRVNWGYGQAPRLERTKNSGTTWQVVADLPLGGTGEAATGGGNQLLIQVLSMNGQLAFRAQGASNSMAEGAVTLPYTRQNWPIIVTGKNCHAAFATVPVTWPATGTFLSAEQQRPWYNTGTPDIRGEGSASGVAASDASSSAWLLQYLLTLTRSSATSPLVRQVRYSIPAQGIAPSSIIEWTTLPGVLGFKLQHVYDPVETTVHLSGHVRVRNHEGNYGSEFGEYACRIIAGYEYNGVTLWSEQRFLGILGTDADIGTEDGYLSLDGRDVVLRDRALLNPPYQDGDCIYHAVREYAEYAGIHDSWFVVGQGAPYDSWTCDGITCDPALGHFRLGVGTGFQPLWREEQGTSAWQAIQHIRSRYGMAVGFTPDGHFTMYPWQPWLARVNWAPVQSFDLVERFSAGYPQLAQCIGELRKQRSLRETRNSLALIGIDQANWMPMTAFRWDPGSIFGSFWGISPPNYRGRIVNAVDSSTVYADPSMMGFIADRMFNALRQPRKTITPLTCFAQPLNVLNYVAINQNRAMANWDKFFVSIINEDWHTDDESGLQSYMMILACDLVPYNLGSASGSSESAYVMNGTGGADGGMYAVLNQSNPGNTVYPVAG